jgi:type IV secretion system protein TrbB
VHANDAESVLIRIGQLIQEANVPANPELLAETVNVVVSIKRTATGRTVDHIVRVAGYREGAFVLERGID